MRYLYLIINILAILKQCFKMGLKAAYRIQEVEWQETIPDNSPKCFNDDDLPLKIKPRNGQQLTANHASKHKAEEHLTSSLSGKVRITDRYNLQHIT